MHGATAIIAAALLAGPAGDGQPSRWMSLVDRVASVGRAESTCPADFGPTAVAAVAALGELGVTPGAVEFRAISLKQGDEVVLAVTPAPESAAELLRGKLFEKVARGEALAPAGVGPLRLVRMTFRGEAGDGRAVQVDVIRAEPPGAADAPVTTVTARVGNLGDEGWSRDLFGKVAARLDQDGSKTAPPAPTPSPNPED